MELLEDRDYFSDHVILKDPYAYFEAIRAKGPIYQLPGSGMVVVTGFDEILEVLKNTQDFSSVDRAGRSRPRRCPFSRRALTSRLRSRRTGPISWAAICWSPTTTAAQLSPARC